MALAETIKVLDDLRQLELSRYPAKEIIERIRLLRTFPVHSTELHVGNVIYRVRPNEGKPFEMISDLSYKPQNYNKTYQRASTPSRTMFYGSFIPVANQKSEIDMGRVIVAAEGSKLFRDKNLLDGQEVVTFGMWRLQATARLATVLHPDLDKNVSPFAIERATEFMNWLAKFPDHEEEGRLILEFYAGEFAKDIPYGAPDYTYMHSAHLTDAFIHQGFDGVIYPSVRTDQKGLNVALTPDFVNAHMRLEGALECVIAKKGLAIACDYHKVAWLNVGEDVLNFKELKTLAELQQNIELLLNAN